MRTIDIIRTIRMTSRAISVPFEMETGHTLRHLLVLDALYRTGDLIQRQVSDQTGIDRSSMTTVINNMVAAGLVCRMAVPNDSRAKMLRITAKGKERLVEMRNTLDKLYGEQFGLSKQKTSTLKNLLHDIAESVNRKEGVS